MIHLARARALFRRFPGFGLIPVLAITILVGAAGSSVGLALAFGVVATVLLAILVAMDRVLLSIFRLGSGLSRLDEAQRGLAANLADANARSSRLAAHVGATRRQLRVLIEQGLVSGEDVRSRRVGAQRVARLKDRLWGGFETEAVAELEAIQFGDGVERSVRADAAAAIASWHSTAGRHHDAYRAIALTRLLQPEVVRSGRDLSIEADTLVALDRRAEAHDLIVETLGVDGLTTEELFRLANTRDAGDEDERLADINQAFAAGGVALVTKRFDDRPLSIDNLDTELAARSVEIRDQPLVSVIMPMHNSADFVEYAIGSVLDQTWANLNVVVVDDGSDDDTPAILTAIADRDDRVEVHRRERSGAYAARNFGLSQCRGQYITVHDADDWSHPQKVELQVHAMRSSPGARASWSFWIRCSEHLQFCEPSLRPQRRQIVPNFSSLMFERSVFDDLGVWDEALTSSDAEFVRRFEAFEDNPNSLVRVLPAVPLSFGLRSPRSLTASGATGVLTLRHITGARRHYREAYRAWHSAPDFRDRLPLDPVRPPFARPRMIDPVARRGDERRDVVMIGDFSDLGGRGKSLELIVRALVDDGVRVGVLHLPIGESNEPPRDSLLRALDGERLRVVSSGETVETDLVLVDDVRSVASPLSMAPTIEPIATICIVRSPLTGVQLDGLSSGFSAFGLSDATWFATNHTLDDHAASAVSSVGSGHRHRSCPIEDVLVEAPPVGFPSSTPARVAVLGADSELAEQLGSAIHHSSHVCAPGASDDPATGEPSADHADEADAGADIVILADRDPVDQQALNHYLSSGVPVIASGHWIETLGRCALQSDEDGMVALAEGLAANPARWNDRAAAIRALRAERRSDVLVEWIRQVRFENSDASTPPPSAVEKESSYAPD